MHLYRIRINSGYGTIFSYVKKENIKILAEYVNSRILDFPKEKIMSVALVENYDDDTGIRVFTDEEYEMQYFYVTYQIRLIRHHEKIAV